MKKNINLYMCPEIIRNLRIQAAIEDRKTNLVVEEAIINYITLKKEEENNDEE